jgi:antitoxin (DNA-binding transcriptional repressor) of toxin-antitoxin stability system
MTVSVKDAQADLLGLIRRLPPGDTLTLTDNDVPVATVVAAPVTALRPPPGLWKGKVVILSEDDDYVKAFEESAS